MTTRLRRTLASLAAAGALACGLGSAAVAGSVTQPGETAGLAAGAPLPEGLYFVNTGDWGCRNTSPETSCLGVDIPVGAWSTPWKILGGRLQFLVATPALTSGVKHTDYNASFYNPLISGQLAWDLGGGWGFSYLLGAYIGVNQSLAWDSTSINQRFALSYTGNDWNLTANVIWGIQLTSVSDRAQVSPCPVPNALNGCNPDFLNVDLTATKKFGKWELGVVGYGSTDLNSPVFNYAKQSQFAAGPLLGYNFGPVTVQAYFTHDLFERNYGGHDTRLWTRFIIPIWTPPAAPAPTTPLYRKG